MLLMPESICSRQMPSKADAVALAEAKCYTPNVHALHLNEALCSLPISTMFRFAPYIFFNYTYINIPSSRCINMQCLRIRIAPRIKDDIQRKLWNVYKTSKLSAVYGTLRKHTANVKKHEYLMCARVSKGKCQQSACHGSLEFTHTIVGRPTTM